MGLDTISRRTLGTVGGEVLQWETSVGQGCEGLFEYIVLIRLGSVNMLGFGRGVALAGSAAGPRLVRTYLGGLEWLAQGPGVQRAGLGFEDSFCSFTCGSDTFACDGRPLPPAVFSDGLAELWGCWTFRCLVGWRRCGRGGDPSS